MEKKFSSQVDFLLAQAVGGIVGLDEPNPLKNLRDQIKEKRVQRVQCFPFFSVMMALGNPTIDYFSLDVEGSELGILKTIPFSRIDIKVMTIEINHYSKPKQAEIRSIMESNGFELVKVINKQDFVFQKKGWYISIILWYCASKERQKS